MRLFDELKRRNVFRVGIAYLIGAWLLLQIADVVLNNIAAPGWVFKAIMLLVGIGLPIALFFAWAFEMTPEGVKRESAVDHDRSVQRQTAHKLDRAIIVVLVIALAYFIWQPHTQEPTVIPEPQVAEPGTSVTQKNVSAETPAAASQQEPSIAVLPFINMSSDPEQEYFSDGITEEIINALVKIPGLSVPARTSVFGFKGHQGDVKKIGRELGVAHILEGSIRSQGKQVRITAQLIKVDDGFHLWSETYDRKLDNIFAVQEEIAGSIARILTGKLGLEVSTVPNQTRNMGAYDVYLQGRALLRKRDEKAVEMLEKATRSDPDFAPALAALAIAYQVSDNPEHESRTITTAERALQIDENNVDALDAIASELRGRMQWQQAEGYFDRALAIDPQSAELLEDYAEFLAKVGRTAEALKVTTHGYAIEPNLLPLSMAHTEALLSNGKLNQALELTEKLASAHPDKPWIRLEALSVFMAQSDISPTDEWLGKLEVAGDFLQAIRSILAGPGNREAIDHLKHWYSAGRQSPTQPESMNRSARQLLVWAGASDYVLNVDLATLDKRPGGIYEWGWTPVYKNLRQNPRFAEFLQTAGLINYWDATAWPEWCWRKDNGKVECK